MCVAWTRVYCTCDVQSYVHRVSAQVSYVSECIIIIYMYINTMFQVVTIWTSTSWLTNVDEMKDLWCSSTVRLLSTQI